MGRIRVTSRVIQWSVSKVKDLDFTVLDMVTDIHRVSSVLAPKDKRNLVNSARIKREGVAHYKVIFGGGSVPYARRRHFENEKNPQTLHYLERAGDSTARNIRRYLSKI